MNNQELAALLDASSTSFQVLPTATNAPITITRVQPGEYGYVRGVGTIFLVTNNTSETISTSLSALKSSQVLIG